MKRYVLLSGDRCYGGGWGDFVQADDDLDVLKAKGESLDMNDWAQIIDLEICQVILERRRLYNIDDVEWHNCIGFHWERV